MEVIVRESSSQDIAEKSISCDLRSLDVDKSVDTSKSSKRLKRKGSIPGESRRKKIQKETTFDQADSLSDSALNFGCDIALASLKKKEKISHAKTAEISNGLSNDVVVPKRPRGSSRARKIQTPIDSEVVKESSRCGKEDKNEAMVDEKPIESGKEKNHKSSRIKENGSRKKKVSTFAREDFFEDEAHLAVIIKKLNEKERLKKIKIEEASEIVKVKESSSQDGEDTKEATVSEIPTKSTKRKNKSDGIKENGSRDRSISCNKKKKKAPTSSSQDHLENKAHLANVDEKPHGEESDVGNLEENAAIMLSSLRFDTTCTKLSTDRKESSSEQANGYYEKFRTPKHESSVDDAGRTLRPRRRGGKNSVRKRRHFYEVCSRDIDPYLILKQRIRVFWPLDKSWYFGLVKEYDPVTRLHHVKYDDREQEWIDLRNERVKLLLFPSELSNFQTEASQLEQPPKDEDSDGNASYESCSGNSSESELIISWLKRKKHYRKLSSSIINKNRKGHTSVTSLTACSEPPCTLPEVLEVKSRTGIREANIPFVYSRRRFRKGSSASVNIAPLSADKTSALELNAVRRSVGLKHVRVKISLQPTSILDLVYGTNTFSLLYTLLFLRFGVLINVWPLVRMEIIIVDNNVGLRLLRFEGSLRWAVGLLCSATNAFYQQNKQRNLAELQMPCTSIGFKLSGIHDQGSQLLFVLYNFLKLDILKWKYLEGKFNQQCSKLWELSARECTHSNIKNLLGKGEEMLGTSVYKNAVSNQAFPGRPFSDIMHHIISDNFTRLNMYPSSFLIDDSYVALRAQTLSFVTSPSFFMGTHMKLLIEGHAVSPSVEKHATSSSRGCKNNSNKLTTISPADDPSDQASDITIENSGSSSQIVALPMKKIAHLKVETDALSFSSDGDWRRSSDKVLGSDIDTIVNSNGCSDLGLNESDETVVRIERSPGHADSWQDAEKSCSSHPNGSSTPEKSEGEYNPGLNNASAQSQQFGLEEQSGSKVVKPLHPSSDLACESNDYAAQSTNPTGPRRQRTRQNSISPTSTHWSNFWSDDFVQNGFTSASKKPRTQVSYSSPQNQQRKTRSYKKVKTANTNRVSSGSPSGSYHESLTCDANILITVGDRGWREYGAQVLLDSGDQEWRICVKLSGLTKYDHKVQHIMQPGITNRYTHAMMWKGGKDWTLEFTDRGQWSLFKEIHEECYNNNIRAAYVKNIPIPGVRLIADADDHIVEVPFVRSSKYYKQMGTEVDMALDPSNVLYDMDSGDEEWISEMKNSLDKVGSEMSKLTDDLFERVMDTFEKYSYAQQCDEFSIDEIEEFMIDVGPLEVVEVIYEHWRRKRVENALPLIRQFQPPLWMIYEQQLKDWEHSKSRMLSSMLLDKARLVKKPTMFAFCLRPRGLEVPNKCLKQRSHKKFISAGCHRSLSRGQFGRKTTITAPCYESSDSYYSDEGSRRPGYPKFSRNNSSEQGIVPSPRDLPIVPFAHSKRLKTETVYEPNTQLIQPDGLRRHRTDFDEFRLRDASSAAKHAGNMAKLKRERAQWLLHKADLAIHKATNALIIADAIKESESIVL